MNDTLDPQKKTRAKRAGKFVKWLLIVVAAGIVINWAGSWMVASSNQRKIDDFQEQVGAKSLKELAGAGRDSELLAGNGWYFYMAAIGCVEPKTAEVFSPSKGEEEPTPTDEQKADREAQLDRAHPLVAAALASPKNVAVLHYDDPINMRLPHMFASMRYARLACSSARDHLTAGRSGKAAERLLDSLAVSEGVLQLPTLLCLMVRIAGHHNVLEVVADDLAKLSTEALTRLADRLAPIDMDAAIKKAFAGEVFFGLHAWKQVSNSRDLADDVDFPDFMNWGYMSLVLELDKRIYLNRMIPMALEPTPEAAKRLREERLPFYAILSKISIPMLGNVVDGADRSRERIVVAREALRLELARRKSGKLPAPRREIDGMKLEVKETDEAVVLTAPGPGDDEPFTIVLRR